jgi:hypothetical protein
MALFGFTIAFLIGLYLIVQSIGLAYAISAFSGKFPYGTVIMFLIGVYIMYVSIDNAPFTVTFGG